MKHGMPTRFPLLPQGSVPPRALRITTLAEDRPSSSGEQAPILTQHTEAVTPTPSTARQLVSHLHAAISLLLLGLIRVYQLTISPLFGPCCRFAPSCSHYAAAAIRSRGPWVGGFLAIKRILRCNPLFAGGYDPPPPAQKGLGSAHASVLATTPAVHSTAVRPPLGGN